MGKHRRSYDAEFKREALRLLLSSGKRVEDLARDLGIHPSLLWRWRRQLEEAGENALAGEGPGLSPGEEVERLRRELEQVKLERDFLKKAAAYFAKESR